MERRVGKRLSFNSRHRSAIAHADVGLLGYSELPNIHMTELWPREVAFPVSVRRDDDRLHFAVEEGFTITEAHR